MILLHDEQDWAAAQLVSSQARCQELCDRDELLACEVHRYVIFCLFNILYILHIQYGFAYFAYSICFCIFVIKWTRRETFADLVCARLRSDGVTSKNVKLFGKGFLNLVDHCFWHLPFSSMKQAHSVRQKANVTEEEWETRWNQIIDEH
jgi:hypothetical protein